MSFTHLHVHTEYSLLDGAARIKKVIARAKELGMDSLAITDHGVMFGVVDFYKEAKAQGIRPILGCEVYTAARTMYDKDPAFDKKHGHLILLAETQEGYSNLVKIVSAGFKEGFYYKPRIDYNMLRSHSRGLICLSGCLAGRVQRHLLDKNYEKAKAEALELLEIFGEGNFFLEIQDQGLEAEAGIRADIIRLSRETGIPMAVTNDVHYVEQSDSEAHDVLLCIQTGTHVDDPDRMRFETDQFYLKSEKEMRHLFPDLPEAIENTQKIADRCHVEFEFHNLHLPQYQPPEGYTCSSYLRSLCETGCVRRYKNITPDLSRRLEYELSTIESMGYVEYFLIVWDFINYARSQNIMVGPGRGSAAGSIVAYSLGITDIDPISNGLIFERFLNPERVSMPDIDVDFCYERRHEVIEYVIEKYGKDKVSQIVTFGTMKAKAAVRDVGRVLGMGYGEVDRIAKLIPDALKMTIDKAMELSPELKRAYERDKRIRKLIELSKAIEGMPRHASTHAAGVVISRDSLDDYVPLYVSDKGVSTQFNMTTIEELGLLKMDFLALRNLTVIRDALDMIEAQHGIRPDLSQLSFDDSKVYEMISRGDTVGVFQLESGGMTQFMKNLRPDCFEDIVAGISLYRPGPMDSIPKYIQGKKDKSSITYAHPSLEPILSVTYGCLVYQEQVMEIVRELAGYSYGRSDLVRRAMSKKKAEVMNEERQYFIYGITDENGNVTVPGCIRNGVDEAAANIIFDDMVKFAEYAFNKSHAAAYAVLAYQTAWLKCYYPVEFMAALMTSVITQSTGVAKYIRSSRESGIEVLPPDVLESGKNFTVKNGKIRFGLQAVKNVGEGIADSIINARDRLGPPRDVTEFINRIESRQLNKKSIESLIRAGALDSLNPNRAQLLAVYSSIVESAQADARRAGDGQMSLFTDFSDQLGADGAGMFRKKLPDIANFEPSILLSMEKEMLGVYVTGHPLDAYEDRLKRWITMSSDVLADFENQKDRLKDGQSVVVGGMITKVRTQITKKNQMMAFMEIEDLYGSMEIIVFPRTFEECGSLLREDAVVVVKGKLNFREDETPKIIANVVTDVNTYQGSLCETGAPLKLIIPAGHDVNRDLTAIAGILKKFPGETPVYIKIEATGKKIKADDAMKVTVCDDLHEQLYNIIRK